MTAGKERGEGKGGGERGGERGKGVGYHKWCRKYGIRGSGIESSGRIVRIGIRGSGIVSVVLYLAHRDDVVDIAGKGGRLA